LRPGEVGRSNAIVFVQVSDPVGDGFVESLAHPVGNATGFTNTMSSLGGKWVELLKEAAPGVSQLGYLFNRAAAPGAGAYYLEPLLTAAAALGRRRFNSNCATRTRSTASSPVSPRRAATARSPTQIRSSP